MFKSRKYAGPTVLKKSFIWKNQVLVCFSFGGPLYARSSSTAFLHQRIYDCINHELEKKNPLREDGVSTDASILTLSYQWDPNYIKALQNEKLIMGKFSTEIEKNTWSEGLAPAENWI